MQIAKILKIQSFNDHVISTSKIARFVLVSWYSFLVGYHTKSYVVKEFCEHKSQFNFQKEFSRYLFNFAKNMNIGLLHRSHLFMQCIAYSIRCKQKKYICGDTEQSLPSMQHRMEYSIAGLDYNNHSPILVPMLPNNLALWVWGGIGRQIFFISCPITLQTILFGIAKEI